eukprot:SAG31_NODE_9877_length_1217_cov_1.915027_1_plen_78_part_10
MPAMTCAAGRVSRGRCRGGEVPKLIAELSLDAAAPRGAGRRGGGTTRHGMPSDPSMESPGPALHGDTMHAVRMRQPAA